MGSRPRPTRDLLVALGCFALTVVSVALVVHGFGTFGTDWGATVPGKVGAPWGATLAVQAVALLFAAVGTVAYVALAFRGFRELRAAPGSTPESSPSIPK